LAQLLGREFAPRSPQLERRRTECGRVGTCTWPQGWVTAVLSLLTLKPAVDTYNIVTNAPRPKEQTWSHETVAGATRFLVLATADVPLGLVQLYVALSSEWDEIHLLQIISLVAWLVSATFVRTATNAMIDSTHLQGDPIFYGFYPERTSAALVTVGDEMLGAGYLWQQRRCRSRC
jgi:hypothetical protein